jgi:FkbM family methyltransferase
MVKWLLKKALSSAWKGRMKDQLGVPSVRNSLQLLKRRAYEPRFVIDGGAYEANWTAELLEIFPHVPVLMIEAQQQKTPILQAICSQHRNVQHHQAILAAEDGKQLLFSEDETASRGDESTGLTTKLVLSESLGYIIERDNHPFADFIKLDVQGYELKVLRGGLKCLKRAEFVLLEVSLLDIGNEPLILEVMQFMDDFGFQAYDICQFMRRPYDSALYQIDLLFIKKISSLIALKRWN